MVQLHLRHLPKVLSTSQELLGILGPYFSEHVLRRGRRRVGGELGVELGNGVFMGEVVGVFNLLGFVKPVQKRLQFWAAMFYNTLLKIGWQLFGGRALFADKVLFQLILVAVSRLKLEEGVLLQKMLKVLFTRKLDCSIQKRRTDGLNAWQLGGLEIRVKIGSVFCHLRN